MVTPPALMAATPVGATITAFLEVCCLIYFKNVVLPVPALPVKKICLDVLLTRSAARLNMVFELSVLNMYELSKLTQRNLRFRVDFNNFRGFFDQNFHEGFLLIN